jgi:hypothetical protein
MPSSPSGAAGEGKDLSLGKWADVGDGTTSLRRLFAWVPLKLEVFQGKADVPGRD